MKKTTTAEDFLREFLGQISLETLPRFYNSILGTKGLPLEGRFSAALLAPIVILAFGSALVSVILVSLAGYWNTLWVFVPVALLSIGGTTLAILAILTRRWSKRVDLATTFLREFPPDKGKKMHLRELNARVSSFEAENPKHVKYVLVLLDELSTSGAAKDPLYKEDISELAHIALEGIYSSGDDLKQICNGWDFAEQLIPRFHKNLKGPLVFIADEAKINLRELLRIAVDARRSLRQRVKLESLFDDSYDFSRV